MNRRLSDLPIRTLLPLLVLIAALPTVAIIISTTIQQHRDAVIAAENRATGLVGKLAERERQQMEGTRLMLGTLAETTEVRNLDRAACTRIFSVLLKKNPSYSNIQETSADGRLIASARPLPADRYPGDRNYIRDPLHSRQFAVGEFIIGLSEGTPMLNYSQPVLARDGTVIAVLQAGIDLERLENRFAEVPLPAGASLVVTDYAGTIIYRSFPRENSIGTHDDPSLFGLMKSAGESGVLPRITGEADRQLRVFGKVRLVDGKEPTMYIRVAIPEERIYGEPRGALIRNIILMVLVGGVSLAFSRLIGTVCIAEPLERMGLVSGALKKGNLAIRSELPHSSNEIGSLAQAFDEMALSVAARELERDKALEELEELAVQALEESARLEAVIAAIGDGISIQGTDFRVRYQNEKHKAMLGDSVGRFCYEAYGLQSRSCDGCPITLAFTDHLVHTTERTVVGTDGVPRHFEITASPVRDADGSVSAGVEIVRDITLRKTMEDDLLRTNEALIKSNRELQHFAYITSHDLREPLRTITSFIQLLKKRYSGKLDTDADDFIGFIVDGADRMQQLINDLLRYARVDSKGKALEPVDSNVPLKLALANLGTILEETGSSVISETLPVVLGDKVQLIQLFQNLIGNAVKFKDASPPEIVVSCTEEGEFWRFSVKDNGIGIDPEDSERIFELFTKLHSREQYDGTGIGLAVCKKIVERHGGMIGVESAPGSGASFQFTLRKVPS